MRTALLLLMVSLLVWGFCGAIMGIGMRIWSIETTLIVHLVGAPVGGAVAAWAFQRHVGGVPSWAVAAAFVGTALILDLFLVAMLIERSFAMFRGPMGVWLPLGFLFLAAWAAGAWARQPVR